MADAQDPDVAEAIEFFKRSHEATKNQREREADDLLFQIPDVEHQWTSDVREQLGARTVNNIKLPAQPMLCVSTIDEPILLQLNQERAAHLGVEIHPLTEEATDDTAKVLQGLYRNIEVTSRAHLARSWGFDRGLKAGRGAYRVLTEYDPDSSSPGDQRITIKRVLYQESVYFDPFAEEPDFSDADEGGVIVAIPEKKYKKQYPDSEVASLEEGDWSDFMRDFPDWFQQREDGTKVVMVAEYYKRTHDKKTIQATNWKGEVVTVPDPENRPRLSWKKVNGREVLEQQDLPGRYIPLIPFIGRELQPVNGERHWMGMIRPAKDGARLTNYAASKAVKLTALEPEAPWIMEEGQDEGNPQWQQPHLPWPVLRYRRIGLSGLPGEAPQRVQVDVSRLSPSLQLLSMGKDFVQRATATFSPSLGENTTAHRSGKAIEALQGQSVTGNSNYLDNEAQITLPYEARVVLDMIPYYYDRPGRIVRILDENDKASSVMLNQPHRIDPNTKRPTAVELQTGANPAMVSDDDRNPIKHYDLNKGRYGVSVRIAKSSQDRLQAGEDAMSRILETAPELMAVIGPEWAKFQDNPAAQAVYNVLVKNRNHTMPWLSDAPQGPDPQQLAAENQALKQQLEQAGQIIQTEAVKQRAVVEKSRIEADRDVEIQRMKNATAIAVAEIQAQTKGIISQFEAEHEAVALAQQTAHDADQANRARAHEVGLASQAHAQSLDENAQTHDQALTEADQSNTHAMQQAEHAQAIQPAEPTGAEA